MEEASRRPLLRGATAAPSPETFLVRPPKWRTGVGSDRTDYETPFGPS